MITIADIEAARRRIRGVVAHTPCPRCVWLEPALGAPAYLKLESLQESGSFKERGAANRLLQLDAAQRNCGVIAASAGNHAQAVALHARRLGIHAVIVMPETTPNIKIANTRNYGAEVVLAGLNYDEAYAAATVIAAERGLIYVHAFDDPQIVAGQGTIGLELLEQVPDLGTVVVPVGGGGLIGGIACAVKTLRPQVRVVGVESRGVPSMQQALLRGEPVAVPPAQTLADGIAVRRVSPLTLALAQRYVDEIVLVDEEEIASAVLFLVEREKSVAEGAGAAAVAALLGGKVAAAGGAPVIALVGGGNIDVTMLGKIIDRGLVRDGRLVRLRVNVHDRPGGLAALLQRIASLRGNIVEVQHERAFSRTSYGDVEVLLTIETEGAPHAAAIQAALAEIATGVERLV
jgi:threonine dehydratase